jgi:hypothetical protein
MQQFRDEGKTFVLVSHDLEAVREMCDRTILLEHGRVVFDGPVTEGVELYRQRMATAHVPVLTRREDDRRVHIEEVVLLGSDGDPVVEVAPSQPLTLRIRLRALAEVEVCSAAMTVTRGDGTHLYELHTAWQGVAVGPLVAGQEATVDVRFTAHLLAGHYVITTAVTDLFGRETWAVSADAVQLSVEPAPGGAGLVDLAASTSVVEGPARHVGDPGFTGPIPLTRLHRRRRLQGSGG